MFPRHRHLGAETTFVLEGVMHDRGKVYGPGAIVSSTAGTAHDYRAAAGRDLVILSVHGGVEYLK